jgi:divalent metal cation (Fe/Co/Zn/Cd) transporter
LALAAYVVLSAVWSLWKQHSEDFSPLGFAVTVAAIPIMSVLSKRKLKVAGRLGSRARADAVESITCGYLAAIVVVGLLAQILTGFWWIDALTSLGVVWFLIKEGREAWRGECCAETPDRKFGWFVEPSYSYSFNKEHEQSLGVSMGLLIPIP